MTKLIDLIFGIQTAFAQVGSTATDVKDETSAQLSGVLDFIIVKIPSFIAAIIVFAIFFLLSKAIKGIVESRMATAFEEHKEIQILTGRTAAATTLILGATVALNIAGIDLTVIIAAAGFGIGFALKDIITNFLSGIMILAQKHFTIGDFIKVNGTMGKIIDIQARATILKAIDGTKVIVPNGELFSNQVKSFTSNPFRRIEIPVCVAYGENVELAIKTCYAIVRHTKGILLEPKPGVLVTQWGDNNVDMVVRAWVDSRSPWLKTKSDLTVSLLKGFDQMNIRYDFKRVTIDYDKDVSAKFEESKTAEQHLPEWLSQVKESKAVQEAAEFKPYIPQGPHVDRPGASFLNVQQEFQQVQAENQPVETESVPLVPQAPAQQPAAQVPQADIQTFQPVQNEPVAVTQPVNQTPQATPVSVAPQQTPPAV